MREKTDMKKLIKVLQKRQKDTLALFGIEANMVAELEDVAMNSPNMPITGHSRSASMMSIDRYNNTKHQLRDVIEEEFSHDDPQVAEDRKVEKNKVNEMDSRATSYANLKKSVS